MAKANDTAKKPNFFKKAANYFSDLRSETKKVIWPTKKQIVNNTLVVLAMILAVGIFVWGLDALLSFLVKTILQTT